MAEAMGAAGGHFSQGPLRWRKERKRVKKRILDPCCGGRMMWFDPTHPEAIFGDRRSEIITVTDRSHGRLNGQRVLKIEPDVLLDFRELPYPDGSFKLIAFDPPHLERAGARSWMAAKYGKLGPEITGDTPA
jgi:hypothetical protein